MWLYRPSSEAGAPVGLHRELVQSALADSTNLVSQTADDKELNRPGGRRRLNKASDRLCFSLDTMTNLDWIKPLAVDRS
jgi:hypothetical protein